MLKPVPVDLVIPEAKPKADPIDNTELMTAFKAIGGRVMHFRPRNWGLNPKKTRGLTIAFVRKNGRIELATAVQHKVDDFTKKIGTKTAVEHFNAGKTVTLPFVGGRDDDWILKNAFEILL